MTFPGLDPIIHHPEDVEMVHELRKINADLLEALKVLFNLLEDELPPWYLRKHYNIAKQAIERT